MLYKSIGRATWRSRKNRKLNLSITIFSLVIYSSVLILICHCNCFYLPTEYIAGSWSTTQNSRRCRERHWTTSQSDFSFTQQDSTQVCSSMYYQISFKKLKFDINVYSLAYLTVLVLCLWTLGWFSQLHYMKIKTWIR